MDEALARVRSMNEDRDLVLSFFKRLDDLREEIIAASDELHIMKRDKLSHYNDDAQRELKKAFNLLWESQHNLNNAGIHAVKSFSAHHLGERVG